MNALQTDLFAGPAMRKPAAAFGAHETIVRDGQVVVRLRLAPNAPPVESVADLPDRDLSLEEWEAWANDEPLPLAHTEPLLSGPLTFGECQEWEDPCALHGCRYRLGDDVERRTRRPRPEVDDFGNAAEDLEGPRLQNGSYFRETEMGPGDWCALRVAEQRIGDIEQHIGKMFDMPASTVHVGLVVPAIQSALREDAMLDGVFFELYGDRERPCRHVFIPPDEEITSAEAKRLVVPGEETCVCAVPQGGKGEVCSACGVRIKRGRQALTVRGRRKPRRDMWAGTVRVVPDVFKRADGTTIETVEARLLEPLRVPEIPAQFRDMNAMLRARGKAA